MDGRWWRDVAAHPALRRLQLAFLGFSLAEYGTWFAVLFYAFEQGGVGEAGAVAVAQLIPAMLVAPFAAFAGDRFQPSRALAVGYGAQSAAFAATCIAMAIDVPLAAYAAAAVAASAVTFTRPVMGALLPSVVDEPRQLVAANVATGVTEHVGELIGPLVAGVLIAGVDPAAVLGAGALATATSAVLVGVRRVGDAVPAHPPEPGTVVRAAFGGFAVLGRHVRLRWLVGLAALVAVASGVVDVLTVTVAEEVLGGGGDRAGALAAAAGLGALAGVLVSAGLVRSTRAARYLLAGAVLASLPIVVLASVDVLGFALAVFAVVGAGVGIVRVTTTLLVQRLAPAGALARVFGIDESLRMGALAAGSLAVSATVSATSLDTGVTIIGLALAVVAVLVLARTRALGVDAPPVDAAVFERVRTDPVVGAMPGRLVDRLARAVRRLELDAAQVVFAQGDVGDDYYMILEGAVDVAIAGRPVRAMAAGESFGEIALLHDVARTATVTTTAPNVLLAVDRDLFLETVTGHGSSLGSAGATAARFLAADEERRAQG